MHSSREKELARLALTHNVFTFDTQNTFLFSSGIHSPIYNNQRVYLRDYKARRFIVQCFAELIRQRIYYDRIAGIAIAGIAWATSLADMLQAPLLYIRNEAKDHGLGKRIEGMGSTETLNDQRIIVIDDTISTGKSVASAIDTLREAGGIVTHGISIFDYGLPGTSDIFKGNLPWNAEGKKLVPSCELLSLLSYETLIAVAQESKRITRDEEAELARWREDPLSWKPSSKRSKI